MNRIIYTYLLMLIGCFASAQEVVYFPAGNKAYEVIDSVVTFYRKKGPLYIVDLKNLTKKNLRTGDFDYLWTLKYDTVSHSWEHRKFDKLGNNIYKAYEQYAVSPDPAGRNGPGGTLLEGCGALDFEYNEYGQSKYAEYDEYGVRKTKKREGETYDAHDRLIIKRDFNFSQRETHYNYDSLGRLEIEYSIIQPDNKVETYKEYIYEGNSEIKKKEYFYLHSRGLSFILNEWTHPNELHRQRIRKGINMSNHMHLEQLKILMDSIRRDESKAESKEIVDTYYLTPDRIKREVRTSGKDSTIINYKYDSKGRLSEQIKHNSEYPDWIASHYFYYYDPKDMDFKQK